MNSSNVNVHHWKVWCFISRDLLNHNFCHHFPILSKNYAFSSAFWCSWHISYCICPKLEMIECYVNLDEPIITCPLVPVDDGIFRRFVRLWEDYYSKALVFMFRDCPFRSCQVPDSCLIKHYIFASYED
jgi:hypothetical protein